MQPDPPCVAYQCPNAEACALELLACGAFEKYLLSGALEQRDLGEKPTGERYDALFARVDEPLPRTTTLVP